MKKKFKIDFDIQSEYTLIGISSQLKEYRLVFHINKELNLNLKRLKDFKAVNGNKNLEDGFSFFYCFNEDSQRDYCLISNINNNGRLLPSEKQIDCFLIVNEKISDNQKKAVLSKIRKISNVYAAFELDIKKIKNTDIFLSDLEIHITETLKKKGN